MDFENLTARHDPPRQREVRGIFASIFVLQNRLQTIFDKAEVDVTLKQFMLLAIVKNSDDDTTFTHLGHILGSSRQNIKKLALLLEEKGFLIVTQDPHNKRKGFIELTPKAEQYFVEINQHHVEKLDLLFQDFTDEELHLFYQLVSKLYDRIELKNTEELS